MITFFTYIAYFKDDTFQSVGVTTDLKRRFKLLNQIGTCKAENACKLVYYEEFQSSEAATNRENELNEISESELRKIIQNTNPMFVNLLDSLREFIL